MSSGRRSTEPPNLSTTIGGAPPAARVGVMARNGSAAVPQDGACYARAVPDLPGAPQPVCKSSEHLHTLDRVRRAILAWYAAEHRDFPWRGTGDPYAVLVSE